MKAKRRKFGPVFKFGMHVPRAWRDTWWLQDISGHTKWTNAENLEMSQLMEYETFNNLGKHAEPPPGYEKIKVHFVYDVKHDLRYKARFVTDGHLTNPTVEQTFRCGIPQVHENCYFDWGD